MGTTLGQVTAAQAFLKGLTTDPYFQQLGPPALLTGDPGGSSLCPLQPVMVHLFISL